MKPPSRIAGIILAGGRSSRMDGRDKATLPLAGRTLLERAIQKLQPQVALLAVNSNADPASLPAGALAVVPDSIPGFPGPLAGILAGMEWAHKQGADYVATAACDTPFFPHALVERLEAALTAKGVALASSGGMAHPVFALWPVELAQDLRAYLDSGARRSVLSYAKRHSCTQVLFEPIQLEGEAVDSFFNINTPEDLAEAERLAQKFAA